MLTVCEMSFYRCFMLFMEFSALYSISKIEKGPAFLQTRPFYENTIWKWKNYFLNQ